MQTEKVVEFIVNWLKNYATNAGFNGFIVGISGGIDSAVTSTLCVQTGLNVLCIEMPIHQAQNHVTRAQEHIALLKSRYSNVDDIRTDLTSLFEEFKTQVFFDADKATIDMALANTRARLRMTTLYYYAGLYKLLVTGTGNKIEDFAVGFYTKYGDGGVDLSPIADLVKSQIYKLGEYLEVPKSIMKAAPSDGLFGDTRSDEDQIGASYPELEWAMKMNNQGKIVEDFSGRKKEVFKIYKRFNNANKHKMTPIPICEIPTNLM